MGQKEKRKAIKMKRALSNKKTVVAACVAVDAMLFFLGQYLFNLACNIPLWLRDLDHASEYIGLKNAWFQTERIRKMPGAYMIFCAAMLVLLGILDALIAYRIKAALSEGYINEGQKGIARWTTNQEIKEQYKEIPDRDKAFPGAGGTIVSRIGKSLYIDDSPTNNLIIGITRSGKGEMFVFPSIDVYSRAEEKTSMVICDPKMELYKSSRHTLESRGYEVHLLNLDDPLHSMGFNPLEQIREEYLNENYAEAELLAQSFSYSIFNPDSPANTDAFWQDTASSLLTALILAHIQDCIEEDRKANTERYKEYVRKQKEQGGASKEEAFAYSHENERKITMYSIINTFTELARIANPDNPNLTALDSYFSERPMLDRAKLKYAAIEVAGDRTKSSIFASMLSKLTIFTFENVAKMTAESSMRLEEVGFGKKPVAVFLGIPDYDKSTHFLATVFIRQMTFVLEKKATRMKTGKCRRKVKFICDEFGNLPAIEGMESIITVCLGRNISFDLYIQAYSQVHKLYGDNAETICGNCGNQIFILTNDDNTAESFSKNLGNETVIDTHRSGNELAMSKSFTELPQEKPLLNMNELEELREGECVVKRVMKRRGLKGERIRPTPIFNSEASGKRFLYRYEYLSDTFPDPDKIDMRAVNTEDRSHIDHRERVWDYDRSFALIAEKKSRGGEAGGTADGIDGGLRLGDLENAGEILGILRTLIPDGRSVEATEATTVTRMLDMLSRKDIEIEDSQRQQLISMIAMAAS